MRLFNIDYLVRNRNAIGRAWVKSTLVEAETELKAKELCFTHLQSIGLETFHPVKVKDVTDDEQYKLYPDVV